MLEMRWLETSHPFFQNWASRAMEKYEEARFEAEREQREKDERERELAELERLKAKYEKP